MRSGSSPNVDKNGHPLAVPAPLRRARWLARLLDSSLEIPGLRWRIGLDPLLGLIPGLGDIASMFIALWLVVEARRLKIPFNIQRRMLRNIVLDALLGSIPILGDLFDFHFKANTRNLKLIEEYLRCINR